MQQAIVEARKRKSEVEKQREETATLLSKTKSAYKRMRVKAVEAVMSERGEILDSIEERLQELHATEETLNNRLIAMGAALVQLEANADYTVEARKHVQIIEKAWEEGDLVGLKKLIRVLVREVDITPSGLNVSLYALPEEVYAFDESSPPLGIEPRSTA